MQPYLLSLEYKGYLGQNIILGIINASDHLQQWTIRS